MDCASGTMLAVLELVFLWPLPSTCAGASRRRRPLLRAGPFVEPIPLIILAGGRMGGGFFAGADSVPDSAIEVPFTFIADGTFSGRLILLILCPSRRAATRVTDVGAGYRYSCQERLLMRGLRSYEGRRDELRDNHCGALGCQASLAHVMNLQGTQNVSRWIFSKKHCK